MAPSRQPNPPPSRRLACVLLLAASRLAATGPPPEPSPELAAPYRDWLQEVDALLLDEERQAFLSLSRDYQRDLFIERFWQVRDPFPDTIRNEFLEDWRGRVALARKQFGDLSGDRARALLLMGPPRQMMPSLCAQLLKPLEMWTYDGADHGRADFHLVFVLAPGRPDAYRLWEPFDGYGDLLEASSQPLPDEAEARRRIAGECFRGEETLRSLERAVGWHELATGGARVPVPNAEWVAAFMARSTDLPPGSETLPADLRIEFPGRRQSRTVLQGVVAVPRAEAAVGEAAGRETYNFLVDGEILRDDRLFERFRYRFDLPAGGPADGDVPLAFERYLRPSDYTLILKVEDLNSQRLFRAERAIEVPVVTAAAPAATPPPEATALVAAGTTPDQVAAAGPALDLGEANAALGGGEEAGEVTVKLLPPPERLHTDRLRVEARTTGDGIAKVTFWLNGHPQMSKSRPPYSVELDLGRAPRLHTLEAVALDADGRELARDRVPINAGPHRFAVRLVEPRPGQRYRHSLRIQAEVDLPQGENLDRVEFFLNETRLATLYQPPFTQPVLLPPDESVAYVRAVAYLVDGNWTEDLVFVNAPANVGQVTVQFVELFTSVSDRHGRPVEGLDKGDFTVLEDGVEQSVVRFETARDLPIHAGVMLDCSTSMLEELPDAVEGALRFFRNVLQSKDRAAVVVFNDQPELKVPFTNQIDVLAGGLAHLTAEGETALYDSLVYTLYYFSGIKGKRAIILLSDGEDSNSRHTFDETLEFARRSGVAIYTIGINLPARDVETRMRLDRLARETGGDSFQIRRASELTPIYARIEDELRSQYLLGYQSSQTESDEFRAVEVRLDQPGLEAKTIPGYYP